MPFGQVGVSGYTRRSSTGKVVNVSKYTQRRDLADMFSSLGRVGAISAKPGQLPGGRALPTTSKSAKISKVQIQAQKRQLAAMRQQVAKLRKSAPADLVKSIPSSKELKKKTYAAKKKTAAKKESQAKEIEKAQKLLKTRGTDNDKLKEATNFLQSVTDKQKNREAASKKAAATKAATIDEMVAWIDANADEIDANGINIESALQATGITRDMLSNPDTPRTRAITQEEFDELWERGKQRIEEFKRESSAPEGIDRNWEAIKEAAFIEASEEWGGVTIDTHTGVPVADRADLYALTVKDPGQLSITVPIGATREEFDRAMDKARKEFDAQFRRQQHHLGVFNNVDTGLIEIDPVLVVDNLDDVESIGAYTHAVGGAFRFSDELGYWPPYVGTPEELEEQRKKDEEQSLREMARGGEGVSAGTGGDDQAGQAGEGNVAGGEGGSSQENSGEEAKEVTFTYDEINTNEFRALEDYVDIGNGFKQMNAKLRGALFKPTGFGHAVLADEDVDFAIAALNSLMEKSPVSKEVPLFRGFSVRHFEEDGPLPVDSVIEDKGFVSFSSDFSTAYGFSFRGPINASSREGSAIMHVVIPAGFPAIDVDGRYAERGHADMGEREFILPPGTKFRVLESRRDMTPDDVFTDANGEPQFVTDTARKTTSIMKVEAILPDRYTQGESNANTAQGTGQALPEGQAGQASSVGSSGTNDLGAGGREDNPSAQAKVNAAHAAAIALASPTSLEAAKKVWETDLGNGYRSHVYDVTSALYKDVQTVLGTFMDADGSQVGSFSRVIDMDPDGNMIAVHKSLFLSPNIQGQGLGAKFNAAAEEKYRQMGLKAIALSADEVGGYAWARAGYDWSFDSRVDDRSILAESVSDILYRIDSAAYMLYGEQNPDVYETIRNQIRELNERVRRFEANESADVTWLPTPYELSQIGWQPGAEAWPGKNGMIGSSWDGIKYLD